MFVGFLGAWDLRWHVFTFQAIPFRRLMLAMTPGIHGSVTLFHLDGG